MEEIAQVYARALFEVAVEQDALDEIRDQLGAVRRRDAREPRAGGLLLLALLLGRRRRRTAWSARCTDANPAFVNFLQALIERHRMPAIFRIRDRVRVAVGTRSAGCCRSTSPARSSWIESLVESLGERIGEQVDREVEISSEVDPDILGGVVLRVGNVILDASIKNRLEQLRKQVAQA